MAPRDVNSEVCCFVYMTLIIFPSVWFTFIGLNYIVFVFDIASEIVMIYSPHIFVGM